MVEVLYRKDEAKQSGAWGTQLTTKRRNEVAEHLGWGRYDSLTIAERNIIQSIIVVENTKKENK